MATKEKISEFLSLPKALDGIQGKRRAVLGLFP